jgi:hypothetical protein
MRLMTWRLHRAFPELDRFSEDQCRRFIRATGRSWRRVPHALLVFLVGLLSFAAVAAAGAFAWRPAWHGEMFNPSGPAAVVLCALAAAAAALAGFLARDKLLRSRVRRVLRFRSNCVACRYTLLGMPVDDRCMVICPECGTPTEVDESLGELQVGGSGERRFTPSAENYKPFLSERTSRRLKRTLIAAGLAIGLGVPVGWGLYEWWLSRQAATARAERPKQQDLLAQVESMQPAGVMQGDPNAWELFTKVQLKMMEVDAAAPEWKDPQQRVVHPDFTQIYTPREPRAEEPTDLDRERAAYAALAAAAARERLILYRDNGVFDRMRAMAAAQRSVRDISLPDSQPAVGILLPEVGYARVMARLNAARAHVALEEGRTDEALDALEVVFALARVEASQPFLIDSLVGVAIQFIALERTRALLATHPDTATLDKLSQIMDRQAMPRDFAAMLEGERLVTLNTAGWVFMDKSQVRWGRFGRTPLLDWSGGNPRPGRLGTWSQTRDAINAQYARAMARLALPPHQRTEPAPELPTNLRVVDILMPALTKAEQSFNIVTVEDLGVRTMIALEKHRAAHAHYPATLDALVPAFLRALPIDPWSGKPLGYRRLPDGETVGGFGYVLYSVGGDGIDHAGRSAGVRNKAGTLARPVRPPPGEKAEFDYVINE